MVAELVADLINENPDKIRAVFVGYTEISVSEKVALVKNHVNAENDWLTNEPDEYIRDHIGNMIAYSRGIKKSCDELGLPYFDTSADSPAAIEAAIDFLVGGSPLARE